ncbi:hypothetical protein ABW21_db0202111 [Orbilia brochopaga]|nr:hypothetical protein ABW21_db0202111 [Drechslerella brochopaga]
MGDTDHRQELDGISSFSLKCNEAKEIDRRLEATKVPQGAACVQDHGLAA